MNEGNAGPIGVVLGVVLLGAAAAFGIALPKATGDDAEPEAAAEIVLPDELPHGLVAQDNLDTEVAARYETAQQSGAEGLEDIYDAPAAVRGYATEDGSSQATITVLDRAPGLFDPHGPPIDPEVLGFERSIYELRRVGDTVCDVFWQQPVQEGQEIDESVPPSALQCQLGDGERTFELFASGLTVEQGVEVLESLKSET